MAPRVRQSAPRREHGAEAIRELDRTTGRSTLADDPVVWNVTDESNRVRKVVGNDGALPAHPSRPLEPADRSRITEMSDGLVAGRGDLPRCTRAADLAVISPDITECREETSAGTATSGAPHRRGKARRASG
jgi:hypothetical protein